MTKIEWTDESWGPIAAFDRETGQRGWFCTKVSPGCTNCYSEGRNVWIGNGHRYTVKNLEKVELRLVNLDKPLHWKKPRMIFVCSMTDLFHEAIPDEFIDQVFATIALCPQHTFQVLTKRPERMAEYFSHSHRDTIIESAVWEIRPEHVAARKRGEDIERRHPPIALPLPHVWLGTSIENQKAADERIPHLLNTPAAVRWVSCEPLLGTLDIWGAAVQGGTPYMAAVQLLHWVVVGGESGTRARSMDIAWARSIVAQCKAAGVPAFVKQLGADPRVTIPTPCEKWPDSETEYSLGLKSKKGNDPSEWPKDLQVREYPEARGA